MSRNVDIEECLVEAMAGAGLTEEQVKTIAKRFGKAAYPDYTKWDYKWGPRDAETGKRPIVEKTKKVKKNGYATAFYNLTMKIYNSKGII